MNMEEQSLAAAAIRAGSRIAYVQANENHRGFVGTGHLRKLMARFDPVKAPVVASTNGEAAMPPALFARALFETLRSGEGDRGGKALLADAALVPAPAGELVDIDRPDDLPE